MHRLSFRCPKILSSRYDSTWTSNKRIFLYGLCMYACVFYSKKAWSMNGVPVQQYIPPSPILLVFHYIAIIHSYLFYSPSRLGYSCNWFFSIFLSTYNSAAVWARSLAPLLCTNHVITLVIIYLPTYLPTYLPNLLLYTLDGDYELGVIPSFPLSLFSDLGLFIFRSFFLSLNNIHPYRILP